MRRRRCRSPPSSLVTHGPGVFRPRHAGDLLRPPGGMHADSLHVCREGDPLKVELPTNSRRRWRHVTVAAFCHASTSLSIMMMSFVRSVAYTVALVALLGALAMGSASAMLAPRMPRTGRREHVTRGPTTVTHSNAAVSCLEAFPLPARPWPAGFAADDDALRALGDALGVRSRAPGGAGGWAAGNALWWGDHNVSHCCWGSPSHVVNCSDAGAPMGAPYATARVVGLTLVEDHGVMGTLPDAVRGMSELTQLVLFGNAIWGSIPGAVCALGKLSFLLLYKNRLTHSIPECIGHALPRLTELALDENELNGTIPGSLCGLKQLSELDVGNNDLSGGIPPCIGALKRLTDLSMSSNRLSGTIPDVIGDLVELQYLDLSHNRLSGGIPESIGRLTALRTLQLDDNELRGALPPSIGALARLTALSASSNRLTGAIPGAIGNLTALGSLYLQSNHLTGSIPASITRATKLSWLDLHSNRLSGGIRDVADIYPSLSSLDLHSNNLSGEVPNLTPTSAELLDLSDNAFSGNPPNFTARNHLIYVNISHNRFTGRLPAAYFLSPVLHAADVSGNEGMSLELPPTLSSRVLRALCASHTRLSGTLPPSLSELPHLQMLDLSDTQLSGVLPDEWGPSVRYVSVRNTSVSGTLPSSLLARARTVLAGSCNLTGELPQANEHTLEVLDVSQNAFEGTLPASLWNVSTLAAAGNLFGGGVPSGMPRVGAQSLSLSLNRFSAELPPHPHADLTAMRPVDVLTGNLWSCGEWEGTAAWSTADEQTSRFQCIGAASMSLVFVGMAGSAALLALAFCIVCVHNRAASRSPAPTHRVAARAGVALASRSSLFALVAGAASTYALSRAPSFARPRPWLLRWSAAYIGNRQGAPPLHVAVVLVPLVLLSAAFVGADSTTRPSSDRQPQAGADSRTATAGAASPSVRRAVWRWAAAGVIVVSALAVCVSPNALYVFVIAHNEHASGLARRVAELVLAVVKVALNVAWLPAVANAVDRLLGRHGGVERSSAGVTSRLQLRCVLQSLNTLVLPALATLWFQPGCALGIEPQAVVVSTEQWHCALWNTWGVCQELLWVPRSVALQPSPKLSTACPSEFLQLYAPVWMLALAIQGAAVPAIRAVLAVTPIGRRVAASVARCVAWVLPTAHGHAVVQRASAPQGTTPSWLAHTFNLMELTWVVGGVDARVGAAGVFAMLAWSAAGAWLLPPPRDTDRAGAHVSLPSANFWLCGLLQTSLVAWLAFGGDVWPQGERVGAACCVAALACGNVVTLTATRYALSKLRCAACRRKQGVDQLVRAGSQLALARSHTEQARVALLKDP